MLMQNQMYKWDKGPEEQEKKNRCEYIWNFFLHMKKKIEEGILKGPSFDVWRLRKRSEQDCYTDSRIVSFKKEEDVNSVQSTCDIQ